MGAETDRKTLWGGLGPALAGPAAILVTIPMLVLGVGAFITWTTWTNQHRAVHAMAADGFERQAVLVRSELDDAMRQGKAVLDAIRHHLERRSGTVDPQAFAWELRDQFLGRPLLAYLGYGTEDGNYYGLFPSEERGGLVFTLRERTDPGQTTCHLREYLFADDHMKLIREDHAFGYDPRTRPWYIEAMQADTRITSDPYAWYDTGIIGVTVAEPYRDADDRRLGVMEMDFNVNTLSRIVEQLGGRHGSEVFIHTDREELLALPGMRQAMLVDQEGRGRVPSAADVQHPAAASYFTEARISQREGEEGRRYELTVDGETWLASVQPLVLPGGKRWLAVCIGSLDALLVDAHAATVRSASAVAIALVVSTLLALFFARHIVRTHVRVARAERAAAKAQDAVRSIGAYHLYKVLGEGGMGEVWLAEHGLLARPVAVKLVNAKFFGEMTAKEREVTISRFEREARTLAQLRSPATITIYDFGVSDDGDLFYVMELLDGMDLYQLVDRHGPQPVGRVIPILIAAARSLAEAHERGLVHRDIKPANIYLCRLAGELDVVKVLDFGMVRKVDGGSQRLTMQGTIEGTPPYMAPEQIQDSDEVDGRADLYALALVGYYLLSGQEQFLRDSPMDTLMAHLNEAPKPLTEVSTQAVPEGLAHVLLACLAKDAADRPPTMEIFIDALLAIPLPPEQRFGESERRNWWASIPEPDHQVSGVPTANVRDLHKRAAETRTG